MKDFARIGRVFRFRLCRVLRVVVSVVLVVFLGMETLPWGGGASVSGVAGTMNERDSRIDPLQVCDHGDSFLGILFEFPVLLPGAPGLHPSPEARPLVQQTVTCVTDGFHPSIDHPPQLSA